MNKLKFSLTAFFAIVFTLGIYSCIKDKQQEIENTQMIDYQILDNSFKSSRITFGKDPGDEFYSTIFNYIESNSIDLSKLNTQLIDKSETDINFQYFTVLYTNKVYKNSINVDKSDIVGFGIASFDKGYISFKLYENQNGIPHFIRSLNFRNEFPTRIFEFFKQDFKEKAKLIQSMIYVNNGEKWKPSKESSIEFEKIFHKMKNGKYIGTRNCGCVSPCCDVDGCGLDEWNFYCTATSGFWRCEGCGTYDGFTGIADNARFNFMNPAQYYADAYFIRDELLQNTNKGRKYIEFYYNIPNIVPVSEIFSTHTDMINVNFGYQTLLKAKLLLPNSANTVVIDDNYYTMAKNILNGYKNKFASNSKFMEILNYIESDIEKYNGWTKDQIINDIN